jgi:predicted dehydrogenase
MLAHEEFDTVYISLMNDRHCEVTLQATEAGKLSCYRSSLSKCAKL